jgi:diadenosine tetraphosphate (Ap4A) HIT family hydrolase
MDRVEHGSTELDSCDFCHEARGGIGQHFARLYKGLATRRIAWQGYNLTALPSVGQLGRGHLLLIPNWHARSFAALSTSEMQHVVWAKTQFRDFLMLHYGPCIVFEHGLPASSHNKGCGVTHAHLHFVPTKKSIRTLPDYPRGLSELTWSPIRDLPSLATCALSDEEYLYYEDQDGDSYLCSGPTFPSQLLRRWLATELGHHWDWRQATVEPALLELLHRLAGVALAVQ